MFLRLHACSVDILHCLHRVLLTFEMPAVGSNASFHRGSSHCIAFVSPSYKRTALLSQCYYPHNNFYLNSVRREYCVGLAVTYTLNAVISLVDRL